MPETGFVLPVRVYIEDTDAGGIVYYVNYLKYMERARTEFLRSLGFAKPAVVSDEWLLVVHGLQVDYHRPARLDDQLTITATPVKLGGASLDFEQRVWRDEELLCSARVQIVAVNRRNDRAMRIPTAISRALTDYLQLPVSDRL